MVSEQRLAANRLNAAKSTGPTTPEDKARVSQNSSTHGAFCRSLVLPNEDKARFLALRRAMLASLNPQNVAELFLADRVCSLMWRLDRLQGADAEVHQTFHAADARASQQTFDVASLPEILKDVFDPLNLPASEYVARAYQKPDADNPFVRLAKAEQRLQGMLNTTLRRLDALQDRRRHAADHPDPACPFLGPDPDPDDPDALYATDEDEDDEDNDDTDDDSDDDTCDADDPQNKPTTAPHPAGVPTSVGHANPRPHGEHPRTRKLQNKPNPRAAHALYQAATRAAGDLLPPPNG
jgi:hypothetical protein